MSNFICVSNPGLLLLCKITAVQECVQHQGLLTSLCLNFPVFKMRLLYYLALVYMGKRIGITIAV